MSDVERNIAVDSAMSKIDKAIDEAESRGRDKASVEIEDLRTILESLRRGMPKGPSAFRHPGEPFPKS